MNAPRLRFFLRAVLAGLGGLLLLAGAASAIPPAPFEDGATGLWGYRDAKTGRTVIPPTFLCAGPFNRRGTAFALFAPGARAKGGWFLINARGEPLLEPFVFDNGPDDFSEGLARFVRDGKMGFFDRGGDIVIPALYDFAWPFEGGAAMVCQGCVREYFGEHYGMAGGLFSRIDAKGRLLEPFHAKGSPGAAKGETPSRDYKK